MAITTVRNETPNRLILENIDGDEIILAPLQSRAIDDSLGFDCEQLEREGIVSFPRDISKESEEKVRTTFVVGGFWLTIAAIVIVNRDPFFGIKQEWWPWIVWSAALLALLIIVGIVKASSSNSFYRFIRSTLQLVTLTIILAISVGLPMATIYYFGEGQSLLKAGGFIENTAAAAELAASTSANTAPQTSGTVVTAGANQSLALFGRLVQLSIISIASLLPILLFFLFDRFRMSTLRDRLYINLFRLDRHLKTTAEIRSKYGSQIDEVYGTEDQGHGRLSPASRWPVLLCALVITIGWILVIAPVGSGYAPKDAGEILASLTPIQSTFVFGFLGAYFFSLRMIALRYARGDLKPKAYSHIVVRFLIVAILSWVMATITIEDSSIGKYTTLILAFLFGIAPDEFFVWLKDKFQGRITLNMIPKQVLPLNELEGIDNYDIGRLESEGIVNIEGLAHHDLIDLIIETRIPIPRLIDWVDQAILYLHLKNASNLKLQNVVETDSDNKPSDKSSQQPALAVLHNYGIRTATDLKAAWDKAAARGDDSLTALKNLLGGSDALYQLEVVYDAIADDEWFYALLDWRNDTPCPEIKRLAYPISAAGLEQAGDTALASLRYSQALSFYLQTIKLQDSAAVRRKLATLYLQADSPYVFDPSGAKIHATRALELAPENYQELIVLFEIFTTLDDKESADRVYKSALKIVDSWKASKHKQQEIERLQEFAKRLGIQQQPISKAAN